LLFFQELSSTKAGLWTSVAANILLVVVVLVLAWPRRTILVRTIIQWYQTRGEGAGPNPHDTLNDVRDAQQLDHDIAAIHLAELVARPEPPSHPETITHPEAQTRPEAQTHPAIPAERLWAIIRPEPVGAPSAPPEDIKKLESALRGLV